MTTAVEINRFCTYATVSELNYLRTLASVLGPGVSVVMLGAGPGVMAVAVMEGNPKLNLTIVDHETLNYVSAHLLGAGLGEKANLWQMDSAEAARHWSGGAIGLLIVDADHTYEGVKRDLQAWAQFVAHGGYIFLHDYDARGTLFEHQEQYPGVMQAVDELLIPDPQWNVEILVGTAIVFKHV